LDKGIAIARIVAAIQSTQLVEELVGAGALTRCAQKEVGEDFVRVGVWLVVRSMDRTVADETLDKIVSEITAMLKDLPLVTAGVSPSRN